MYKSEQFLKSSSIEVYKIDRVNAGDIFTAIGAQFRLGAWMRGL
jgi:hypothetical protein